MADGMFSRYKSDLAKVQKEFDTGDRNLGEYILGTGYYGVARPVEQAIEAVTPNLGVGEFIGEQLQKTGLPQYLQENTSEDTRRALGEGFGLFGVTGLGRMAGGVDPARRGMFTTGGQVYKTGHYNPTEVKLSSLEEKALSGFSAESVNRYKALKGNIDFTVDGLKNVAEVFFNPKSRALYTEYGLNPVYRKTYKEYTDAVNKGDTQKAKELLQVTHNQAQAMENIKRQAGQQPRKYSATENFALAASDPNAPALYGKISDYGDNWYDEMASPGSTFGNYPQADSKFIQDHIMKRWGIDAKNTEVLVKTPRSDITGNHFVDVLGRNPSVTKVTDMFVKKTKQGSYLRDFDTVPELKTALEKVSQQTVTQAGKEKRAFKVLDSDDTGVWIETSGVGRAKVEGGVNMLIKVEPDGNLTGVMSDVHNFLEKIRIPGTNKVVETPGMKKALPTDVVAVTPPMQTNVVSVSRVGKFGDDAEVLRERQGETMKVPERARSEAARQRLAETSGLTPSGTEVARQSLSQAQDTALVANILGTEEE